ncbi:MAG: alpha/beta hydrolase [Gammaproteobacteria bacterium]|nr:alpha/beta hydrolase [Gammaproteobacteria bacterium]
MINRLLPFALIAALSVTAGCALLRPAAIPMTSQYYHYQESSSKLVVLLHGRGGSAGNFVKNGVVEQIRACQPEASIVGVDSYFAYYRERIIEERLREDVIKPALDAGVEQIWLLGVSVGGLGSLVYRLRYTDDIEAIILMAPYLGEWDELSVYAEDPQLAQATGDPDFIEIWDSVIDIPLDKPAITLAFGALDDNNRQHRWLAGLLDESRVVSGPGGHNWSSWKKLWPEALRRSGLCDQE